MIRFRFLSIFFIIAALCSCDDTTPDIGGSTIPGGDHIDSKAQDYSVTTNSILMDSVYARTSTAYLGRYTDPVFGEFTADFMAQFTCLDDFKFPEHLQEISGLNLFLQYGSFYGDSLALMKMQIDTLNRVIPEVSSANFYTSINPSQYIDKNAAPLITQGYSAGGPSVDTIFTSNGSKVYNQTIKLPKSLGDFMYKKYTEDKNNYKDAEAFIKNVLKGFYVQCTSGDGSVLYIDNLDLRISFKYLIESSSGKVDSLVTGWSDFAATKEVIQANHFENSSKLKELADDTRWTYIKSPAGIATEVTIPMEDIYNQHKNDTLNSASISFKRYNDDNIDIKYKMSAPNSLLMLRKKDLYSFFENNKIADGKTSFVTSYGATNSIANTYSYSNIAELITYCINEKEKGIASDPNWLTKNPDWNKVVLVPVKVEYTSDSYGNSSIISIKNSLAMESVRLVGGKDDKLTMKILYTKF